MAGRITLTCRENYTMLQGELRHVARFGRPPAYIRAAARIYWSGRPDMCGRLAESDFSFLSNFVLCTLILSYHNVLP